MLDRLTLKSPQIRMAIVAIMCWIFASWVWYPGFISGDLWNQYMQASSHTYISDWHPPIFARFWQLEMYLFNSAYLLPATWSAILSLALFIFLLPKVREWGVKAYLLLFFCPSFFGLMGIVAKDTALSNCIFLVCSLIVLMNAKPNLRARVWLKVLVAGVLVLVTFLRFNATFITAPLLVGLFLNWKHNIRNLFVMLAVVLIFLGITRPVNQYIFQSVADYPETSLELFDIAGIAHQELSLSSQDRDNVMSSWDVADQKHKLAACYTPQRWDTFGAYQLPEYRSSFRVGWDIWDDDWNVREPMVGPKKWTDLCQEFGDMMRDHREELKASWIKSIKSHPVLYLEHRWNFFIPSVMGYIRGNYQSDDPGIYPWSQLEEPTKRFNYIEYAYRHTMYLIRHFAPWNYGATWLLLDIIIFVITIKKRQKWEEIANGFSFASIMYIAGYFVVGVGRMYRYILPSVYITIAILLVYLMRSSFNRIVTKNK